MPKETFSNFVRRHRFKIQDILPSQPNVRTSQDFELAKCFPQHQRMEWHFGGAKLAELNRAFLAAQYMSTYSTNEAELFARLVSDLHDQEWLFALQFCAYHKVHSALQNLEVVHSAIMEACLGLNSAMGGMEAAFNLGHTKLNAYEREQSKAISNLLNFSALYASYIDVCERIRKYVGLEKKQEYQRAVSRIMENVGEHRFVKGYETSFCYHLVEPYVEISWGEREFGSFLIPRCSPRDCQTRS